MKTIKKFGSIYNEAVEGECLYNNRLDTYWQWCSHNCSYCYAKSLLDFRWLRHPNNPKFIDLKEAYRIIAREIPQDQITRLWWMTDCFQPVEKIHKITYNVLKAFNKCRKWYLIITKSDLIATDEYLEVLDKDLAHIQITITTTNDELAAKYEHATRPSDRIKAIEKLQKLWYDVQIRLSPFVPWLCKPEEILACELIHQKTICWIHKRQRFFVELSLIQSFDVWKKKRTCQRFQNQRNHCVRLWSTTHWLSEERIQPEQRWLLQFEKINSYFIS